MVCDRVPPVLSLLLRLMNPPYVERVLPAGCDFGGLVSAFDDLSFCSACVWRNCPLFCFSPHRIAKVESISSVWVTDCPCGLWFASLETWCLGHRPTVLGDVRSCNAHALPQGKSSIYVSMC
jgi:hypothetical protein